MKLQELLEEHGKRLSVSLTLDSEGSCYLTINERWNLQLEQPYGEPYFFIHGRIATLPESGNEAIYRRALEANLFLKQTDGGFFSLDSKGMWLTFTIKREHDNTDFHAYIKALETAVSQIAYWSELFEKEHLKGKAARGEEKDPPPQRDDQWIKM